MSKTDLSQLKPAEARVLVALMTHAGGPLRNSDLRNLPPAVFEELYDARQTQINQTGPNAHSR